MTFIEQISPMKKYLAPLGVIAIALMLFSGALFAYTASLANSFDGTDVIEEYHVILADTSKEEPISTDLVSLTLIANSETTFNGTKNTTTLKDLRFVKSSNRTVTVTDIKYTLNVILENQAGNYVSGQKICASATPKALPEGKTSAVASCPSVEGVTDANGGCTLTLVATLLSGDGIDESTDYMIPSYDIVVYRQQ